MTNGSSDRMDRIEALLQQSVVASNERMTRLELVLERDRQESNQRMTQLELVLERDRQESNQRMTRLEESSLSADRRLEQFLASAESDRVVMHEVIDQLVTVRDENKRILEYLFGQQRGNGRGDQPQS